MQMFALVLCASPLLMLLLVTMIFDSPSEPVAALPQALPVPQKPAQRPRMPLEDGSPYLEKCVRQYVVRCPCAICSFERLRAGR